MRRLMVAIVSVTIALLPARSAAQVQLEANDCGGTTYSYNWTCTSNHASAFTLVGSFIATAGLQPIGQESILELAFMTPVPAWWRIGAGECRAASAMSVNLSGADYACVDYFGSVSGGSTGSYEYLLGPLDPGVERGGPLDANRARLVVRSTVDSALALEAPPPQAGDQVFLFSVSVNRTLSVGTGSCPGCADPVCVDLRSVKLLQPAPLGARVVAGSSALIMLQGYIPSCYVATNRSTWGQVKSLYR